MKILLLIAMLMSAAPFGFGSVAGAATLDLLPIELPNEHEAIHLQDVEIVEKNGRQAIKGLMLKTKQLFMPRSSHLHIDFTRQTANAAGEVEDVVVDRQTYLFRRRDFRHSRRIESFFKYIDPPEKSVEKIVVEAFTQSHSDSCGKEDAAPDQ